MKRYLLDPRWRSHIRWLALGLLVVALLGPWAYEHDGKPPAEWCREPYTLITAGAGQPARCVGLIPGSTVLLIGFNGGMRIVSWLVAGTNQPAPLNFQLLLVALFLGIVLPFTTPLARLARRPETAFRLYAPLVWVLALVPPALVALTQIPLRPFILWGVGLFTVTALLMLVFEILARRLPIENPTGFQ